MPFRRKEFFWAVLLLFPLLCGCFGGTCLGLWDGFWGVSKPWNLDDWDYRKSMDFRVGDRFRILCPMFLVEDGAGLHLQRCSEEEIQACLAAPKSWKHVVQILYPGTEIEIMALKMGYQKFPLVYVRIADVGTWIGVSLYEPVGLSTYQYMRRFFKKLDPDDIPKESDHQESVPFADPPESPRKP